MQRFLNAVDKTPSGPAPACSPSFPLPRWPRTAPARILFCSMYSLCMCDPQASRWLSGKKSTCQAGDAGSIPVPGRPPGGGHGNPLQDSCLKNPMDRGAWRATVHGVAESDTTEQVRSSPCNPSPPAPPPALPLTCHWKTPFPPSNLSSDTLASRNLPSRPPSIAEAGLLCVFLPFSLFPSPCLSHDSFILPTRF